MKTIEVFLIAISLFILIVLFVDNHLKNNSMIEEKKDTMSIQEKIIKIYSEHGASKKALSEIHILFDSEAINAKNEGYKDGALSALSVLNPTDYWITKAENDRWMNAFEDADKREERLHKLDLKYPLDYYGY